MTETELISIIVPVYKVEDYLSVCVESIINQTYQKLEIILVDDGSPDNCADICDMYSKEDNRIIVIHKANGGLSDARNIGLENAAGKYVMFIDSDDYIHPDMVSCLYKNIEKHSTDIAVCGMISVYDNYAIKKNETLKNIEAEVCSGKDLLKKIYSGKSDGISFVAVCKLYKKSLFTNGNILFPKGRLYEDTFTTHKLLFSALKVAIIDENLYYYRIRKGSITNSRYEKKKIKDSIEANEEAIRSFLKYNDKELTALAYKNFCHSQFKLYYKILCLENDNYKKIYLKYIMKKYKEVRKTYHKLVKLPVKYEIVQLAFVICPLIMSKMIKRIQCYRTDSNV